MTKEQMDQNRTRFLSLLDSITIQGADIEGLKNWLDNSDFFYAPASTIYHNNFEGGLCAHSLNVYDSLVKLVAMNNLSIDQNSILVVALLHDISKTNFYESFVVNKKRYYDGGSKHDNMGNFDWYSEEAYKVKDAKDRKVLGNHEESSAILASRFIPLSEDELVAIMHHHCNTNDNSQFYDLTPLLNTHPLTVLLHTADFISTFLIESAN